jgi:hypothetical protein
MRVKRHRMRPLYRGDGAGDQGTEAVELEREQGTRGSYFAGACQGAGQGQADRPAAGEGCERRAHPRAACAGHGMVAIGRKLKCGTGTGAAGIAR